MFTKDEERARKAFDNAKKVQKYSTEWHLKGVTFQLTRIGDLLEELIRKMR